MFEQPQVEAADKAVALHHRPELVRVVLLPIAKLPDKVHLRLDRLARRDVEDGLHQHLEALLVECRDHFFDHLVLDAHTFLDIFVEHVAVLALALCLVHRGIALTQQGLKLG